LRGLCTKWIYHQTQNITSSNNEDERTLEIIADTIIDNQEYFILDGTCACSSDDRLILRWQDNQILQYIDSSPRVLYDFNLNAGDSITVPFITTDTILSTLVIVDSTEVINGLKRQYVSIDLYDPLYQHTDWFGPFVENIGSINLCMTPQGNLCESSTGGLCSFITSDQDTITFPEVANCLTSSTEEITPSSIIVTPNPTSNYWTISNTSKYSRYYLLNITGEEITSFDFHNRSQLVIDASGIGQ